MRRFSMVASPLLQADDRLLFFERGGANAVYGGASSVGRSGASSPCGNMDCNPS